MYPMWVAFSQLCNRTFQRGQQSAGACLFVISYFNLLLSAYLQSSRAAKAQIRHRLRKSFPHKRVFKLEIVCTHVPIHATLKHYYFFFFCVSLRPPGLYPSLIFFNDIFLFFSSRGDRRKVASFDFTLQVFAFYFILFYFILLLSFIFMAVRRWSDGEMAREWFCLLSAHRSWFGSAFIHPSQMPFARSSIGPKPIFHSSSSSSALPYFCFCFLFYFIVLRFAYGQFTASMIHTAKETNTFLASTS